MARAFLVAAMEVRVARSFPRALGAVATSLLVAIAAYGCGETASGDCTDKAACVIEDGSAGDDARMNDAAGEAQHGDGRLDDGGGLDQSASDARTEAGGGDAADGGGCSSVSCPNGCCDGATCVLYSSQSNMRCGAGGAACTSCANGLCDKTNGTCSCGANTCPNGCCNGGTTGTCEAYASESNNSCGTGGAACAGCAPGQECNTANGTCVCDATSCPNGCCNGSTCVGY